MYSTIIQTVEMNSIQNLEWLFEGESNKNINISESDCNIHFIFIKRIYAFTLDKIDCHVMKIMLCCKGRDSSPENSVIIYLHLLFFI